MKNKGECDSLRGYEAVRASLEGVPTKLHMTGIGGVGMAGLALLLKEKGWNVSGCDSYEGPLLPWLRSKGITSTVGHSPDHLAEHPAFIVRSPAVQRNEPELVHANVLNIPVIERGRLLPALLSPYRLIAVSGTHGKTTTASMIAWILRYADETTSYCIGGVCPCLGAVAHIEHDGFMVVEADESDGTLQYYKPDVAVVTNMDIDHVDHFETKSMHLDVYKQFARSARTIVYIADDTDAASLFGPLDNALSVALDRDAAVSARDIEMDSRGCSFTIRITGHDDHRVTLAINGRHNIANALSAVAAARTVGVPVETAAQALQQFHLPLRRYETVATGKGITVISDYAHHPVEIEAVLEQANLAGAKRIVAVFQPHRYSRTKKFRDAFVDVLAKVDCVILLPVYAAFEPFMEGGSTDDLFQAFQKIGYKDVSLTDSVRSGWERLQATWREGDLVLLIGAGNIDVIGLWAADNLNG